MNSKLKLALIRRYSDRGFAMPIAIGMGLIMLLIGAILMMRSQGDQTTALAQKATNQGLSAAETGIARYQSMINNNRAIATYKDCVGTRNSSGTCPDTGTTISWTNATKIPGISPSCNTGAATPVINASATNAWQDVDTNNPSLGQYRLISYVYPAPSTTGTVGVAPGTGQLTVEGRVNQNGSGNTATQGVSTATTRLQVNIPVQQGEFSNYPVPGLWLKSGTMPGNQTTKGNILLNDCSISPAPTSSVNQELDTSQTPARPYIDPDTGQPYQTKQVSFSFPALPLKPTFITSPNNQVLGAISSNLTLPRNGDKSNTGVSYPTANGQYPQPTTGVFEYSVSSVSGNNTITIRTTPGIKVKFYLDGNIAKQTTFLHDCTSSGCNPTDFQIFGYGTSSNTICLNGNGLIDAFIFAPTYSAGVDGNGQFRGSVWTNDFNAPSCSSSSNHMVVLQLASWTSLGLTPQNLPPKVGSISSWQRQESP